MVTQLLITCVIFLNCVTSDSTDRPVLQIQEATEYPGKTSNNPSIKKDYHTPNDLNVFETSGDEVDDDDDADGDVDDGVLILHGDFIKRKQTSVEPHRKKRSFSLGRGNPDEAKLGINEDDDQMVMFNGDHCGGIDPSIFEFVLNNSGIMSQLPIQNNRACYCKEPRSLENICDIRCFPCENHGICQTFGTCCDSSKNGAMVDPFVKSTPVPVCYKGREKNYLVIRSCPKDYDDDIIKALCEDQPALDKVTMESETFVTDIYTEVTYYNKYCAECNNAIQVSKWEVQINCFTYLYVLGALTYQDLLRLSLKRDSQCTKIQTPTGLKNHFHDCNVKFYTNPIGNVIGRCNVTGHEKSISGKVMTACETQPYELTSRVVYREQTFKNIFCLICNNLGRLEYEPNEVCPKMTQGSDKVPIPPFQYIFGFGKTVGTEYLNNFGCSENEWMDPSGRCRSVECTEGKVLKSGNCQTALSIISGLPYRMSLLLKAVAHYENYNTKRLDDLNIKEMLLIIRQETRLLLESNSEDYDIEIGVILEPQEFETGPNPSSESKVIDRHQGQVFLLPRYVWMNLFFKQKSHSGWSRDFIEEKFLNFYIKTSFVNSVKQFFTSAYKPVFVRNETNDFNKSCENLPDNQCITDFLSERPTDIDLERAPSLARSEFIEVRPYLTCPYIKFSVEDVKIEESIDPWPLPHVTNIALDFGSGLTAEINDSHDINQVYLKKNGDIYICLQELKSNLQYTPIAQMYNMMSEVQNMLTIACVSSSLLCLFATITTYCLFSSLRCVAGCNTLGLCSSLFIAQTLLMMANKIKAPSILCTTMGVITHYSWLVMFAWTFLCCLHMLRVFTTRTSSSTSRSKRQDRKAIALNVTMSLILPALIVVVVIVINLVMHYGTRIGYGYRACVMDNVFAIHGPLLFVTICNILFFTIVVCKIRSVRRLQDTDEFWKDFVVYIKLSTVTGMFWLLIFLGELFTNDVIRCLAIVANGCQGVFIFASFIANRRVLKLYAKKFNLSCLSTVEGSSMSTPDMTTATNVVAMTTETKP